METINSLFGKLMEEAKNNLQMQMNAFNVNCTFNDIRANAAIENIFEDYIFGDRQTILAKLKTEENKRPLCGHLFKIGEPYYICRECGIKYSSKLCTRCFKQSEHKLHKYKVFFSDRGEDICDCGYLEVWKNHAYCNEHIENTDINTDSSVISNRMKERCEIAFQAILKYLSKFLQIETHVSLATLRNRNRDDDMFCTVLYNDESHTYEQVIQTLINILRIPQKDAMEIVTSIHREGRAVLRCGNFETCLNLKEAIERQPMPHSSNTSKISPLKVSVLHKRAVACQQFALQLLKWFQEFLTRHVSFRQIFAAVANDKRNPNYNIDHILEYDWKFWQTARTSWHRLLISGMLMEHKNRKILATKFSEHYTTIMQVFIRDDHDHSISILSLSVQLFTVPAIAHHLIANENIFHKLLDVFYLELIWKHVQDGILHFAENPANINAFKRAVYIIFDLRYILNFKPDVWTEKLNNGFFEGVLVLLKLLNVTQGMDAVYRQTRQHIQYEPGWRLTFDLHFKLASIVSLVLEWCSSIDLKILVKIYEMIMMYLMDNDFMVGKRPDTDTEMNSNTIVMEKQTYAGHVANCIMYDVSSEIVSIHIPLSRFFAGIYLHLGKYGLNFHNATTVTKRTPEEIIEPVLCIQTMIAQVHAGMWTRNGDSILHQVRCYGNASCCTEMLDRDISCLQIGTALIESNQFLIHILNKFDLLEWADPKYEQNNRTIPDDDHTSRQINMFDKFLELLIVIIGERYIPGIGCVTEQDRIKREIIQRLCIKNFSHSELNRAIPNTNNFTILDDVIDSIAVFKKPSKSDTKGVYELKEEFYDDYNMFFYHYTNEDKLKSEETQCKRRKNKGLLVCCPPPKLPKLEDGFVSIANLLQCDVMLTLMQIVLNRALDLKAKSFTDIHLQKVLYLIGYGLQEEESKNYPFLTFYERAKKYDILQLLEKLTHSARVETHHDFIIWTVKKFKELKPKAESESMKNDDKNELMTAAEAEKQKKEERAKLAAEHRAKIMAQMKQAQNNFMELNAELFATTSTASTSNELMDWQNFPDESYEEEQNFTCVLCHENCSYGVSKDGEVLVYLAFIQKSQVLYEPGNDNPPAPHTSMCGHVMHKSCWQHYYNDLYITDIQNFLTNHQRPPSNFSIEKGEFL